MAIIFLLSPPPLLGMFTIHQDTIGRTKKISKVEEKRLEEIKSWATGGDYETHFSSPSATITTKAQNSSRTIGEQKYTEGGGKKT